MPGRRPARGIPKRKLNQVSGDQASIVTREACRARRIECGRVLTAAGSGAKRFQHNAVSGPYSLSSWRLRRKGATYRYLSTSSISTVVPKPTVVKTVKTKYKLATCSILHTSATEDGERLRKRDPPPPSSLPTARIKGCLRRRTGERIEKAKESKRGEGEEGTGDSERAV